MNNKIGILSAIVITSVALLTACGPSDEKVMELETAIGLMMEAKESAFETYLDITDSSMESKLEELDARVKELEEIDYKNLSDAKIDEIIPTVTEVTEEYQSLQKNFDEILKKETDEKTEAEKHMNVGCYLVNKTGMNLTSVVLHDLTVDEYSDNLLGENVTLDAGYTLMGVVLDVNKESSEFEFIITNDNNTSFTLSCDDISSLKMDETSITLKYDADSKTGTASFFISDTSEGTTEDDSISSSETSSEASSSSSEG